VRGIYCMGKSKTASLSPSSFTGKRIWVSGTTLQVGTQTPDSLCAADLPAGVLDAVALIGTSTRPIAVLLDPQTLYVRPDGALLGTGLQLQRQTPLTAPWVGSDGTSVPADTRVWTGGDPGHSPTAEQSCGDWQAANGQGMSGEPFWVNWEMFGATPASCQTPRRVYCVER
jgi:hypothetical protein